jgi:hypothetical protein
VFSPEPNYYEELPNGAGGGGLRFPEEPFEMPIDPTEFEPPGEAGRDHTIFDRGDRDDGLDNETSDHTIIVRGGHRGATGPLVYFVERNGMRAGKVWHIGEQTLIGRRESDDEEETSVILNDETVSRRHGKVILEDRQFYYWDLASANGSFVVSRDGSKRRILEPHRLEDGDTIDVGEARLTFLVVDLLPATEVYE